MTAKLYVRKRWSVKAVLQMQRIKEPGSDKGLDEDYSDLMGYEALTVIVGTYTTERYQTYQDVRQPLSFFCFTSTTCGGPC